MRKIIFYALLILGGFFVFSCGYFDGRFFDGSDSGNYEKLLKEARAYESGAGAERDEEKAFEYYCRAALEADCAGSEALKYFEQKAQDGNLYAEYYLGFYYGDYEGKNFDAEKAVCWLNKAARKNYAKAIHHIAWFYMDGTGVKKDVHKGGELMMKAAELGYAPAQYAVGQFYTGIEFKPYELSYVKAFDWFKKAADQGYLDAKFDVGVCYFYGLGAPQDKRKAVEIWEATFKELNEKKSEETQSLEGYVRTALSRCYYNGWGCEKSEKKSFELFLSDDRPEKDIGMYESIMFGKSRCEPIEFFFMNYLTWVRVYTSQYL